MNTVELKVRKYELKIESGVGGGSISLIKNNVQIDEWIGHSSADKNDYLIESLSRLLDRNNVGISEISKIIYSENPGSQTGIRIITAIIKGLCAAGNIEAVGKNLFESIAGFHTADERMETIIVLPVKSNSFEFAKYSGTSKIVEGRFISLEELNLTFKKLDKDNSALFIPFKMFDSIEQEIIKKLKQTNLKKVIDLGENLSIYL